MTGPRHRTVEHIRRMEPRKGATPEFHGELNRPRNIADGPVTDMCSIQRTGRKR